MSAAGHFGRFFGAYVMTRFASITSALTATVLLLPGCSDGGGRDKEDSGASGVTGITAGDAGTDADAGSGSADGAEADAGTADGELFDVNDDGDGTAGDDGGNGCVGGVTPNATLTGVVKSPNLVYPISGALVYVTDENVEPVPDGVYCSECVELPCDTNFVLTNPDGSFSLPAVAGPGQKLVVQKGEFLHVTDIDVAVGTTPVSETITNLPGEWNPAAGLWIPRIAVYDTSPDEVGNVLAKFGLGQVDGAGNLVAGSQRFTLISDSDNGTFLEDSTQMEQYHLIFLPCASTKFWSGAPNVPQTRINNIRSYVEKGGKIYATDHSNEYIEAPFPNYQEFYDGGGANLGDGIDIQPAYTSNGTVVDAEMLAWLQALPANLKDIGGGNPTLNGLPGIETRLNYSAIQSISPVLVEDAMGNQVDVGHKTWVEGPCASCNNDPSLVRPMAISGEYGCGRMLYSTFETSSQAHVGLNPQELALLYMILEIGVCFEETPPPPPPVG